MLCHFISPSIGITPIDIPPGKHPVRILDRYIRGLFKQAPIATIISNGNKPIIHVRQGKQPLNMLTPCPDISFRILPVAFEPRIV
jgi:hypothetical protein